MLPIYPAREEPLPGITSEWLMQHVPLAHKRVVAREALVDAVASAETDVVLTVGAGDIDQLVAPIERVLNQRLRS